MTAPEARAFLTWFLQVPPIFHDAVAWAKGGAASPEVSKWSVQKADAIKAAPKRLGYLR